MTGNTPSHADERAISTVVSHVMSVGITTLLIISLVATATGFLDGHQEQAATSELETIGNRLATELTRVDGLASGSDGVSVATSLPDTVAGSSYTITLEHGSCGAVPTDTCLRLVAAEYQVSAIVPVRNQTELFLESGRGGRFVVGSNGTDGERTADRRRLEMSPRVGIGQSVGVGPNFGPGTNFAEPPVPHFDVRPGIPQTNEPVTFDASSSQDPDGSIVTYEWDFDDDGVFENTTANPKVDHTFTAAGTHNVTLRVTDDGGLGNEFSRDVDISGVEYNGDMTAVSATNPNGVTFTVTNRHSQSIIIERLLIDPANDAQDEVSEDRPAGASDEEDEAPHEIEIDRTDNGTIDGHVDWEASSFWGPGFLPVPADGAIVDINEDGDERGGDVTLAPGETARITVQDFPAPATLENFTFGVRYRIGSNVNSNVFTDQVTTP